MEDILSLRIAEARWVSTVFTLSFRIVLIDLLVCPSAISWTTLCSREVSNMTFFLPTAQAGRVAIGSEVRLVLDAAPQWVIPARATFVASVAQFTPKTVETEVEREKLMFRVRAHIPPDLLRRNIEQVKTGLPGRAFVRLDQKAEWPAQLTENLVK